MTSHQPLPPTTEHESREAALEAETDRLLRLHGPAAGYPHYAASTLRQMSDREDRLSLRELPGAQARAENATQILDALVQNVYLGPINRELLELIRMGWTLREAASQLGIRLHSAHGRLERLLRKLQYVAKHSGGFEALARECEREQTRGNRYHEEQHCDEGGEACRKDGLCKYRAYLYFS
jgi:hypothetical protein